MNFIKMRELKTSSDEEYGSTYVFCLSVASLVALTLFLIYLKKCCSSSSLEAWTTGRIVGSQSDEIYASRLARQIESKEKENQESPEQRRQRLLHTILKHEVIMEVKEKDLSPCVLSCGEISSQDDLEDGTKITSSNGFDDHPSPKSSDKVFSEGHVLQLPLKGKNANRAVSSCCAVCLDQYDVGDEVIWSSNNECPHAFHKECVLEWLVKMQNGTPCPFCRQEFIKIIPYKELRKSLKAKQRAFNPQIVSFY